VADPNKLALYGVDSANVASQVSSQVKGIPATFLRVPQQDSFAVWVQSRADRRASDLDLATLPVQTIQGPVPLSALGQIVPAIVPTLHTRQALQETVDVLGYRNTAAVTHINVNVDKALQGLKLPAGYSIRDDGELKTMDEAFALLIAALMLGLVLLYFSLVPAFNSFIHPITIMVAIPLALIGATWSMLIMGKHSCMPAFMGMILLAGIVVKNSILLIDFIEEARRGGATIEDALVSSVRVRTRPILMTAAATAVGMIPIAGEWAIGLERLSPLAVVAIGGLLVSTLLTLIYVPMFYDLFEKLRGFFGGRSRHSTNAGSAPLLVDPTIVGTEAVVGEK
jgi:multidrug efflux pump subunit AcrB